MADTRSLMTKKIITVNVLMPIQNAYETMKAYNIRHLPVVDQSGKLVGMLSDRDVLRAAQVRMISELEQEMSFNPHHTVEDFMSWPVQTVSEKTPILDLVNLMLDQKVSALIVNDPNHYIKGIVTTEDLLDYLADILRNSEHTRKETLSRVFWGHP